MAYSRNGILLVETDSEFDSADAIQKLMIHQEHADDLELDEEPDLSLSYLTKTTTLALDCTMNSSPDTSPDPTPPSSPNLMAQYLPNPCMEEGIQSSSTLSSTPYTTLSPHTNSEATTISPAPTSDWLTTSSPLTSPDPTPPSSPRQNVFHVPDFPKDQNGANVRNQEKKRPCSGFQSKTTSKILDDRKKRRNNSAKRCRTRKRESEQMNEDDYYERDGTREKYVKNAPMIICDADIKLDSKPIASTGYIGLPSKSDHSEGYTLEELVGKSSKFNFKLQKWDGSVAMGILDSKKRIICILAGHPDDKNWPSLQKSAADALEKQRSNCHIAEHQRNHRRGAFFVLDCGISFGGGQKQPQNLKNHAKNRQVLKRLHKMPIFRRLAGFASSVMATWAPKIHRRYMRLLRRLTKKDPTLTRFYPGCAFGGVSYNFGPKTVCDEHIDNTNAAYGLCGVTPFGDYDYTKGGPLVLWELRLVVEFPPGSTILLPSAIITHSNVKISDGERRYSFVQYTSGSLFRWVDQDFQTKKKYLESLSDLQLEEEKEKRLERLEKSISLFSTIDTL